MMNRQTAANVDMSRDTCLVGSLATWPLQDMLLWLHETRRTSMLRVGNGLDAGVVFFREGTLVRAEYGGLAGEEAVIALMTLADGGFSIIQRAIPEARPNVHRATSELLLQCAIALDERRRPAV